MATIWDTYRRTKKSPDLAWNEYVCRPIAAVIVHALASSRVTPNQITLTALVVALAAAVLLVLCPGHVGLVVAALVFELSYVLDCADGMLARLRGQASVPGHLFDFLMDELKALAILGAAAVRLWSDHGRDARFLLIGIVGLVALASGIAMTTFMRRPEILGPEADRAPSPRRLSAMAVVERALKFVVHYPSYIWLAAAVGHLEAYFFPYVIVNALYAARTLAVVALRFGRS